MFKVEGRELGDDAFDGSVGRQEPKFRLRRHLGGSQEAFLGRFVEKRGEVKACTVLYNNSEPSCVETR